MSDDSIHFDGNKVAQYSPVEAGLAELQRKYGLVYDVSTYKGLEEAKVARAAVRQPRYDIERIRQQLKQPILAYQRKVDGEASRLTKLILAIEEPIDKVIKAREVEIEAEKARKALVERQRREAIGVKLSAIGSILTAMENKPSAELMIAWQALRAIEPTEADFQEFLPDAQRVRADVLAQLISRYRQTKAVEDERARLEAQRQAQEAEAARQRAEQEAAAAKLRAEQAEAAERLRVEREEHEAKVRAENERIQHEQEELARQRREIAEAEEKRRQEARAKEEADRQFGQPHHGHDETPPWGAAVAQAVASELGVSPPWEEKPAATAYTVGPQKPADPTPSEIVAALSETYDVTGVEALAWLRKTNWKKVNV